MHISKAVQFKLILQKFIGFFCLVLIYFGYWIFILIFKKYKIPKLKSLRKQFKIITNKINKDPLLICPNHLTFIDSVLLILIFNSFFDYIKDFHTLAWNFPKTTHIKKNWFYQIISYLSKCILIDFDTHKNNISNYKNTNTDPIKIAKYLLSIGEYIMLFPEGHRSLDGKVDTKNFAYGVGKLINESPNIKVLCIYLRGHTQQCGSNFPNKGDSFYCKMELFDPSKNTIDNTAKNSELRKIRNIAKNIIEHLAVMEKKYLALQTDHNNK